MAKRVKRKRATNKKVAKRKVVKSVLGKKIDEAIKEGGTLVVIDDRPCSVEISRMNNGNYTHCLKTYCRDENDMLKSIPALERIRKEIEKRFK